MKLLAFVCCMLVAFSNPLRASSPVKIPIVKSNADKRAPVTEFTFWGYAEITFYPNGNIKRIRCRNPKDMICATVTADSPHTLNTYSGGFSTGTYTVSGYTHTVDPTGEDVLDF